MKIIKKSFQITVYIFALIGFGLVAGFFAIRFGLTKTSGIIDNQTNEFRKLGLDKTIEAGPWSKTPEWQNFKTAIAKDQIVLKDVESKTGINARLITSIVAVEQLRMYFSQRETFKEVFSPLKILGTQTQFSWGIAGIKEDTAIQIENNLRDQTSPYYLGKQYENILDFKTSDPKTERFERLTDYTNRYYQYLYSALYLKEISTEWQKSGFDISNRPEILATLFNIGFSKSKPNESPEIGGAEIDIGSDKYSFGRLAGEIYYSNELIDLFPNK